MSLLSNSKQHGIIDHHHRRRRLSPQRIDYNNYLFSLYHWEDIFDRFSLPFADKINRNHQELDLQQELTDQVSWPAMSGDGLLAQFSYHLDYHPV